MKKIICFLVFVSAFLPIINADETLFREKGCTVCHGNNAEGISIIGAPALAGLEENYVVKRLTNFKAGKRGLIKNDEQETIMIGSAQVLSDDDIKTVAKYLSELSPIKHKPTVSGNPVKGKEIFALCQSCHIDNAQTELIRPSLVGLNDWYIVSRLQKFKAALNEMDLDNDPSATSMASMAQALLSTQSMNDVALYILTLDED